MAFLDFLFPKFCVQCKKLGSYLCPNCFSYISFNVNNICLICNRGSFNNLTHPGCKSWRSIDGAFTSISYNKTAQKLLYQFKYKPFISGLKDLLVDLFYEGIIQNEGFQKIYQSEKKFVFCPIPLHGSRFRQRGYNHSEILTQELSKKLNIPIKNLLIRIKRTKPQFGLNRKERKENIKDAFSPNPNFFCHPELVSGSINKEVPKQVRNDITGTIFLVDDILTSGTTLSEAAKVLKVNGAKEVYGLTLARD